MAKQKAVGLSAKGIFKHEMVRAFTSRNMLLGIGIGLLLCILGISPDIVEKTIPEQSYMLFSYGMRFGYFKYLVPSIATIPFAWSFSDDRNSGYLKFILSRVQLGQYYIAKLIAVILAGGFCVVSVYIIFAAICNIVTPINFVDCFAMNAIRLTSLEQAIINKFGLPGYFGIEIFLLYYYSGVWAVLGLALAVWFSNKTISLTVPMTVYIMLQYLAGRTQNYALSPGIYMDLSSLSLNSSLMYGFIYLTFLGFIFFKIYDLGVNWRDCIV